MKLRLELENYAVAGTVWHVSLPTLERRKVLVTKAVNEMVIDALQFQCLKTNSQLLLYCLMPDHIHLLLAVGDGNLVSLMRDVKTWTTRQWQRQSGERRLWQDSFHDHGIRKTEDIDALVKYIIENPVRAGLVEQWWNYPWTGGTFIEP